MRAKRNPMMVGSMIVMGIGQVVQGVGTVYLAADVSALSDRLEIMEGKVSLNAKETKSIMMFKTIPSSTKLDRLWR